MDADGKPVWVDPAAKPKVPVYDESVWNGYGVEYEPLRDFIKNWITAHTSGLDASLVKTLRENYQVTPAGAGATHNRIMGANDNLKGALSALPVAPAAAPKSPTPTTVQPLRAIQREPTTTVAPLTDAEQWEADWTAHPGLHSYFAGGGRPAGSDHDRYLALAPLYKAHGIPRPILYMGSSITTASFYSFSTPAHNDLAAKLKTAENTLTGKGHATAPVVSVWALNARTTSAGGWSNHADGRAVDMDPDNNPHLIDKNERKMIGLVAGTDMEAASPGYDAMKGASDRFKADYNATGMTRRITELKAVETAKKTELDTAKSERDTLNGQRDTLKSERASKATELKAVPTGKKATADDVAKATELKTRLTQIDTNLGSLKTEIKNKEAEIKAKEAALKLATDDRVLLEKQLKSFEATDKAISDLEHSVKSLPDDIKALEDQINQSKLDEQDAQTAKNATGVQAQRTLRAKLQQAEKAKKTELTTKEAQLKTKTKQRDADPLRGYAAGGFLNLPKDVVEAMTGAGLKWGGNWEGAKDFMHFEL
jgi:D-alanyl-D-alanine carboxypeptidase